MLLHTCCAPCSSAIIECMMQHGITPVIYYCNPNIYPIEEYIARKDECTRYSQALGLEIVDADYDHAAWLREMGGMENEPERGGRCLLCFKARLLDTARYAHEHGLGVITTTLEEPRTDQRGRTRGHGSISRRDILGAELAQGRTERTTRGYNQRV